MPTHSPTRFRVAASAAGLAVVARLVSILTWPPDSDASHARMVATAADHRAAWLVATYTETVCWLCAGFAVLTAIRSVTGRGQRLVLVGGWAYGVSLLTLGLVGGSQNATTLVLAERPDRSQMVAVVDALHGSAAMAPFVLVVLLGELFLVVFGIGLARAGRLGWWYVAASVLSIVGYVVTSDSSNHAVVLAGFVPLGATWLALAPVMRAEARRADQLPETELAVARG